LAFIPYCAILYNTITRFERFERFTIRPLALLIQTIPFHMSIPHLRRSVASCARRNCVLLSAARGQKSSKTKNTSTMYKRSMRIIHIVCACVVSIDNRFFCHLIFTVFLITSHIINVNIEQRGVSRGIVGPDSITTGVYPGITPSLVTRYVCFGKFKILTFGFVDSGTPSRMNTLYIRSLGNILCANGQCVYTL